MTAWLPRHSAWRVVRRGAIVLGLLLLIILILRFAHC